MWPITVKVLQSPEAIQELWGHPTENWTVIAQLISAFAIIAAAFVAAYLSWNKERVETKHKKQYLVSILETFNLSLVSLIEKAEDSSLSDLEIFRMIFVKAGETVMESIDDEFKYFITAWQPDLFYAIKSLSVTFISVSEKSQNFTLKNSDTKTRELYIKLLNSMYPLLTEIIKVQRKFAKPWPIRNILLLFDRSKFRMEKKM